jgi:hypothetical protein
VRSALADAEERLAEMKTRTERSELLVTILTDAVARGVNHENPSSKRAAPVTLRRDKPRRKG